MKNIFAVVLNYNDGEDTIRSVRKLASFNSVKKIVIVDNGSTDSSIDELVQLKIPKMVLIKNKRNLGFGRGCNIGIKYAIKHGADGIANLNPDLNYSYDFISPLAKNDADLICPVLKFYKDKKLIYDYGGKIDWVRGRTYHLESTKSQNPFSNIEPDYASGGAALIKSEVFKKIGYFDEHFFIYYEDADFSLRARAAGFSVLIDNFVVIEHKLEIHKSSKNWRKIKNNAVSNLIFINKDVPWFNKITAYPYWALITIKAILAFVF